jgi:hypothetical protein
MTEPYLPGNVGVSQLKFDKENPRLPPAVDPNDAEAVLTFMLDDASLVELAGSIAVQGYFPGEPLLVCPIPELVAGSMPPVPTGDSEYTVVEGNRRLAAVLLLTTPDEAPRRRAAFQALARSERIPATLPVIIFAVRRAILDYLGYRHITGIKEWDPLAKARYLAQVKARWEEEGRDASNRDLARVIGSTGPYVGRLLAGVAAIGRLEATGFFDTPELDADSLPFSLFTAALNNENIPAYMGFAPDDPTLHGVDDGHLADVATWLFVRRTPDGKTALEDSRNMKHLNTAVTNERALEALKEGASVREAARLAFSPAEVFSSALEQADRSARLARRRVDDVDSPTQEDHDAASRVHTAAEEILERIDLE